MTKEVLTAAFCLMVFSAILFSGYLGDAKPYTMHLGSKSDPEAHLFSYDQKFRETTRFVNYNLSMTATKEFTDATRLATRMDLISQPDWVEIAVSSDFIGIGRLGYVVYDPITGKPTEEVSRITHTFIGNFTMDEHIRVLKDRKAELGILPPL